VKVQVARLRPLIDHNFGVDPGQLRIELYATHRAYARQLWLQQQERPQTRADDSSNIVHGVLLLGPLPSSYLRHNLAHVYTEWVLDRLTGNRRDSLPPNPWLYDGLAEFEAYRYAPAGFRCSVSAAPFDITRVRTPRQWLALRGGPLSPMEYCLAYLRVREVVRHLGWQCVLRTLRGPAAWRRATLLLQGSCA
jgi:hypothetical protein